MGTVKRQYFENSILRLIDVMVTSMMIAPAVETLSTMGGGDGERMLVV
jgi:hypothetical protein